MEVLWCCAEEEEEQEEEEALPSPRAVFVVVDKVGGLN